MVACIVAAGAGCSAGLSEPPDTVDRLSMVFVNVHAWNDARIAPILVDRSGRRTGWVSGRSITEIPGCSHGYGSEEGIPDELPPGQSEPEATPKPITVVASVDTIVAPQTTPMYHYFHIQNDVITPVGLIDDGECELRLDPTVAGKVQLGLSAMGIGSIACQDSTSVRVTPGVPLRWRLSWRAGKDTCFVRMERIPEGRSKKAGQQR